MCLCVCDAILYRVVGKPFLKCYLSRILQKVRKEAMWIPEARVFLGRGAASSKAWSQEHA